MAWLFFALALGAILLAFNTFSIGLAAVCLVLALGLILAGTLTLVAARISNRSQSPTKMLDAKAIEAIRQKAKRDGGGVESSSGSNSAAGRQRADQESPPERRSDAAGGGEGGGGGD
jgi:hypothetical protein